MPFEFRGYQSEDPNAEAIFVRELRPSQTGYLEPVVPQPAFDELVRQRSRAATRIYEAVESLGDDLNDFFARVTDALPPSLTGVFLNPDGSPARQVSVEALPPAYGPGEAPDVAWPVPRDTTDARGSFGLLLPQVPVPKAGLTLRVRGADGTEEVVIKAVDLLDGTTGTIVLARKLSPVATGLVSGLGEASSGLVARSASDVAEAAQAFASTPPDLTLGEEGTLINFRSNAGVVEQFGYGVMIRLIEPQLNQWRPLVRARAGGDKYIPFPVPPAADTFWGVGEPQRAVDALNALGDVMLVDRELVSRPIDVTDFYRRTEREPHQVAKAATLGLGYVVHMQQTWIPAGHSLGDLVYSLPLAPGEQQRITVVERSATSSVQNVDTLSIDEAQSFQERQDTSTLATFRSAFDEAANGGSAIDTSSRTDSKSTSGGAGSVLSLLFTAGGTSGFSSSASSGRTNSWQNVSRDFASSAAQDVHGARASPRARSCCRATTWCFATTTCWRRCSRARPSMRTGCGCCSSSAPTPRWRCSPPARSRRRSFASSCRARSSRSKRCSSRSWRAAGRGWARSGWAARAP